MESANHAKWWLGTSEQTRKEVWNGYLSAEYAARYYQALGNRFLIWHKSLSVLTILLGGGAAFPAAIWAFVGDESAGQAPVYAMGVAGVALAITAAINIVFDFAKKAAVSSYIAKSCGGITQQYADLMSEIDRNAVNDEAARKELRKLLKMAGDETYISEPAGIMVSQNGTTSRRAAEDAYRHMETIYVN